MVLGLNFDSRASEAALGTARLHELVNPQHRSSGDAIAASGRGIMEWLHGNPMETVLISI